MSKRRYTESFSITKEVPVLNNTGGVSGFTETIMQSGLAYVDDRVRVRIDAISTGAELNHSVSFEFFKKSGYDIDLSMKVQWRGKKLTIQSVVPGADIRKCKVICSYGD